MEFDANKIMEAIRPILDDPMAGKGNLSIGELVHDRLIAMETAAANASVSGSTPKKKKGRGPNKPKPAQTTMLDDRGDA